MTATRATLNVATGNVKLSFDDTAITAALSVGVPVSRLVAVADTRILCSANADGGNGLCLFDAFRPASDHPDSVVDDKLTFGIGHGNGLLAFHYAARAEWPGP